MKELHRIGSVFALLLASACGGEPLDSFMVPHSRCSIVGSPFGVGVANSPAVFSGPNAQLMTYDGFCHDLGEIMGSAPAIEPHWHYAFFTSWTGWLHARDVNGQSNWNFHIAMP